MSRLSSLYRRVNSSVLLRDLRFMVSYKLKKHLKRVKPRASETEKETRTQSGSVDPEYIVTMDL